MRKLFIILFLVFATSLSSFAQEQDSVLAVSDTIKAESSYSEDYDKQDEIKVLFNDSDEDTNLVVIRTPISDTIEKIRKKEAYQYARIIKEKKKEDSTHWGFWDSFFRALASSTGQFILWSIIIGFMVVVIVMYALDNNIKMFSRKAKKLATDEEELTYKNIFDIDYNTEIQNAVNSNNFNVAARLGYLQLLALLSKKKLIDYGIEKTNFDYQFQLMNTKYYKNFMQSAHNYEYAWYAGYIVSANQYNQIVQHYKNLEQQLID